MQHQPQVTDQNAVVSNQPREDWLRDSILSGFVATFAMTVVAMAERVWIAWPPSCAARARARSSRLASVAEIIRHTGTTRSASPRT